MIGGTATGAATVSLGVAYRQGYFATDKTSNTVIPSDIDGMTVSPEITTPLKAGNYYVFELVGAQHNLASIKNKTITLSVKADASKVIGTFEPDQLIHGQVGLAWALPKKHEGIFMVEKVSGDNAGLTKPYRCKLAGTANTTVDNFDDTCTLSKLPTATPTSEIVSLAGLRSNTTAVDTKPNLSTDQDTFYRLSVDMNKLYNLVGAALGTAQLQVELIPTSGAEPKTLGTVKLLQEIKADSVKGNTALVIAKVTTVATDSTNIEQGKCAFAENQTSLVQCTLYKNSENTNIEDVSKFKFVKSATPTTSSDLEQNKLVLIDLGTSRPIADLMSKVIIYNPTSTLNIADSKKVQMTVVGILGGSVEDNKSRYFLSSSST